MALEIQTELNDKSSMAIIYNNLGQIFQDKGDSDEALKYGKMALVIDEELNDLFQMATDYFNLTSLYYIKMKKKSYFILKS